MEEKSIIAYQGKIFTVTLQSMLGSTNYGWCLASLPEGILLVDKLDTPTRPGIAPVNQTFYFGVASIGEEKDVILSFKEICLSDFSKIGKLLNVDVKLLPDNNEPNDSSSFVKYSENAAIYNSQMPYGFVLNSAADSDVCTSAYPYVKYGYPCSDNSSSVLKYGYPCSDNSIGILKYGYPCSDNSSSNLKYGYPCSDNSIGILKYGYPCSDDNTVLKYGFPNCNTNQLYGYPMASSSSDDCSCTKAVRPLYGYPVLKYGYPGSC